MAAQQRHRRSSMVLPLAPATKSFKTCSQSTPTRQLPAGRHVASQMFPKSLAADIDVNASAGKNAGLASIPGRP
jgi:hypothetical protein